VCQRIVAARGNRWSAVTHRSQPPRNDRYACKQDVPFDRPCPNPCMLLRVSSAPIPIDQSMGICGAVAVMYQQLIQKTSNLRTWSGVGSDGKTGPSWRLTGHTAIAPSCICIPCTVFFTCIPWSAERSDETKR
jgi:hypothetical protein